MYIHMECVCMCFIYPVLSVGVGLLCGPCAAYDWQRLAHPLACRWDGAGEEVRVVVQMPLGCFRPCGFVKTPNVLAVSQGARATVVV